MARFDVFRHPEGAGYLLDVQADLLDSLNTRVVVPLLPVAVAPMPATTLNPVFGIGDEPVVMVTQYLAAVPVRLLKSPLGNLESARGEITAALDLLFQGF